MDRLLRTRRDALDGFRLIILRMCSKALHSGRCISSENVVRSSSYRVTILRMSRDAADVNEVWLHLHRAVCGGDVDELKILLAKLPEHNQDVSPHPCPSGNAVVLSSMLSSSSQDSEDVDVDVVGTEQAPPARTSGRRCSCGNVTECWSFPFHIPNCAQSGVPAPWTCEPTFGLLQAAGEHPLSVSRLFRKLDGATGLSLLHYAVIAGDLEVVKAMLDCGAEVSHYSNALISPTVGDAHHTPLCLAAALHHHDIVELLIRAGAHTTESQRTSSSRGYSTWDMAMACPRTAKALCTDLMAPPSLVDVCKAMLFGHRETADILRKAFRWDATSSYDMDVLRLLCCYEECRTLLEIPCYNPLDVLNKEVFCMRLLLYVCHEVGLNDGNRNNDRVFRWQAPGGVTPVSLGCLATTLVRHGAKVRGWTEEQGRNTTQAWLSQLDYGRNWPTLPIARYVALFPKGDTLRAVRGFAARTPLNSVLVAFCADAINVDTGLVFYPPAIGYFDWPMAVETRNPDTGLSPLLTRLLVTGWDIDDPVVKALFACGAWPHIPSLSRLPIVGRILHNGAQCSCPVELSAEQRQMSLEELWDAPRHLSLQEMCRDVIVRECHASGGAPAVAALVLPRPLLDFLQFKHARHTTAGFA